MKLADGTTTLDKMFPFQHEPSEIQCISVDELQHANIPFDDGSCALYEIQVSAIKTGTR
jgi:hypothetical protein